MADTLRGFVQSWTRLPFGLWLGPDCCAPEQSQFSLNSLLEDQLQANRLQPVSLITYPISHDEFIQIIFGIAAKALDWHVSMQLASPVCLARPRDSSKVLAMSTTTSATSGLLQHKMCVRVVNTR